MCLHGRSNTVGEASGPLNLIGLEDLTQRVKPASVQGLPMPGVKGAEPLRLWRPWTPLLHLVQRSKRRTSAAMAITQPASSPFRDSAQFSFFDPNETAYRKRKSAGMRRLL